MVLDEATNQNVVLLPADAARVDMGIQLCSLDGH